MTVMIRAEIDFCGFEVKEWSYDTPTDRQAKGLVPAMVERFTDGALEMEVMLFLKQNC